MTTSSVNIEDGRAAAPSELSSVDAAPLTDVRYHYLDNLRAIALLAGVIFHVGVGYSDIMAELWPSANSETSFAFDVWTWWMHTFRMPLFFLIAGFFACYLVAKRGIGGFVKNRLVRIAAPFAVFWPLTMAAIIASFYYAATVLDSPSPIIQMIKASFENPEAAQGQEQPLSTTHLWFIYYLAMFCLGSAAIVKLVGKRERLFAALMDGRMLFIGLPVLTGIVLIRIGMPHPAPESFVPQPWALAFYGLFFWVGWVFFSNRILIDTIAKFWPHLLTVATISSIVFTLYLPEPISLADVMQMTGAQPLSVSQVVQVVTTSLMAWYFTFLFLLLAYRFFNKQSRVLRYVSDGSYWVYIVHLPIVFHLQFLLQTNDMPIFLEFVLESVATLGIGYLSYAILVRHTPIGWLLNGRKKKSVQ
ncbi:acyltransferase family protein [Gilvimarinus sp. SDUM040013]|uniref:Acyltransferase family protein n=1 Tax=Gilvimarinus gilvus TaxID=3058038 RepID=A0ABU4RSC4_9GAMM|nr:acyltransferase family protein [Gilvimarinus sp. SDUM040013]MDO3388235.1 acyltransferase family protein [Gilvimarinus sp. SDUM040013]MDX6847785.1 acyltransferase family protein [Gilvimarinus sp. SDUM040013]